MKTKMAEAQTGGAGDRRVHAGLRDEQAGFRRESGSGKARKTVKATLLKASNAWPGGRFWH